MKILFDDDLQIDIGDLKIKREKIQESTPQINFLNSHIKDIIKEAGALKAILKGIEATTACDLMAGCGFSGKMILKELDCKLLLNDIDPICFNILNKNFDGIDITQKDLLELTWTPVDLVFIDFNSFTIKKLDKWKSGIKQAIKYSQNLIITDSACYGFHMGNLKRYNVKTKVEYYKKLAIVIGANLRAVSIFGNAALVHFSKGKKSFRFVEPYSIKFSKQETEGLLF